MRKEVKIRKVIAVFLIAVFLQVNAVSFAANMLEPKTKPRKNEHESILGHVNLDWWQGYEDEHLEEYIVKAIENNKDLKIATLKVEEARQATKLNIAHQLPTLAVGASPMSYKMPGLTTSDWAFAMPIIASYEVDLFLKNHDKTKSSKKVHQAAQLNEKAVYIAVAGAVGATYFNIVKLDKLISLQEEIIKDREQIYGLMKKSNEHGLVSTADMVKAEKAYVFSTSDLIELKKAREIMLNSLAVLTGENPNNSAEFKRISYDKLSFQKPIPETIPSEIIEARPDYKAALVMVEKAGIDVRIAKKEFLPKLDIFGLAAFSTGSMLPAFDWKHAVAGVAGNAMLPIFTGGARTANLKIQKNRYDQVLQTYFKTNLNAIQEVNNALSVLKLDDEKYQKNLATFAMEQKDFKYTQAKYQEGVISRLDLLQRKETLLTMEKMVTSSKIDGYVNQISLYKAVAAADLPETSELAGL